MIAGRATREEAVHDLSVYREKLRLQNETLLSTLRELEEARERYLELYESAHIGYCTLDPAGLIVEINRAAAALLGPPREALVGTPLLPRLAPEHRQRFVGYLRQSERADAPTSPELRVHTAQGERTVRLTFRARRSKRGVPVEYFLGLEDVTDRRRLERAREEARRAHADLVRRMLTLQEAERHRIARDIHDDLGQQMTALRIRLEWLASVVAEHSDLRAAILPVQDAAKKLDEHIDFLLKDLRPAGLEELGLTTVLRQAVADWSATFGVAAEFRTSGLDGIRFSREVETQIFRIVQEALNNVHKHAAATSVEVVLERKHGRLSLCVEDDGVGLPAIPGDHGARRGLGLLGMRERAALIGGDLGVGPGRARGTKVTLVLPEPAQG
jgi:PAS domain S-box-containing protein